MLNEYIGKSIVRFYLDLFEQLIIVIITRFMFNHVTITVVCVNVDLVMSHFEIVSTVYFVEKFNKIY